MLVIDWKDLPNFDKTFFGKGSCLSIGSFDGLHLGHRALFNRLIEKANLSNLLKGVFTFYTPPRYTLSVQEYKPISTLKLKLEKMKSLMFDFIVLVDFSLDFAKMRGEDFVKLLKRYLNIKYLLVGEDFRFGEHRASSIEDIQKISSKLCFSFEVLPSFFVDGKEQKVSSTLIRQAIYEGDISFANSLLGMEYLVDLFVAHHTVEGCIKDCFTIEEKTRLSYKKSSIEQVLPRTGRFRGWACSCNCEMMEEVDVILDEVYLNILFTSIKTRDNEIGRAMPYFDILKLTKKLT